MTEGEILRVLETALLCADQPMPLTDLRKLFSTEEVSTDDLRRLLGLLQLDWQGRGLELVKVADRKSTRLNSSHVKISYAVFCLKKKKKLILEINSNIDATGIPGHIAREH